MHYQTKYLKKGDKIPPYLAYPGFLLEMDLPDRAKLIYILLLNRVRLSMKQKGFADSEGCLYIHYPIEQLAKVSHKCPMTVKYALSELEEAGLIRRKQLGIGKSGMLYVKIPVDKPLSGAETDPCPASGQKPVCPEDKALSGSETNSCLPCGQDFVWLEDNFLSGRYKERDIKKYQ